MHNVYQFIPGIQHPILMSKLSDYDELPKEVRKQAFKNILTSGAFFVINLTEALINEMKKFQGVTDELMSGIKPGYVINVLKDVADLMQPNELLAALHHEDAHIINGDLESNPKEVKMIKGTNFADMINWELAADAHAAAMVGAIAAHSGILTAITATGIVLESYGKSIDKAIDGNAYIDECLLDPNIKLRLETLKKAIVK